ncbi:WD40-repeat-containing domain protein [Pavlovales sp. CCMP2436]|nr:WD40-repeat-containing domain protein [Pavlovales sp. CCMP2436]
MICRRGECAAVSAHKDVVWALGSISGLIVSASEDKLIRVWPASTPPPWECMETLTGHGDAVCCLAVTQNHVFSASSDGMLHMWKLV